MGVIHRLPIQLRCFPIQHLPLLVQIHYVNLAYEYEVEQLNKLPCAQHSEYMWFTKKDLLESEIVHKNVKSFFIGSK